MKCCAAGPFAPVGLRPVLPRRAPPSGSQNVPPRHQCRFRQHFVPLRRQCPLRRGSLRPLRGRSDRRRRAVAGILPGPQGRARRRVAKRGWPLMEAAGLAAARGRRTDLGPRRRLDRGRAGARQQAESQGARCRRRNFDGQGAAGHARFDPCADADPRLPRPRPLPRQPRSARPRAAEERSGARSAHLPLHRRRPGSARSSSTRYLASNSRPSARSSRSCDAPTARRSASSSCTSPTPRRRAGSRNASKGRTRRSPSPARASARSSTSWSRPTASRNSAI